MANMFPFHTVPPAQLPEPVHSPHAPPNQGMHINTFPMLQIVQWSCSFPESSPEYRTMLFCTPQLNDIIAQDPQRTYDQMIAAFNQSVHIREFIRHPAHTDYVKATKLMDFMTDQVKTSPSDFGKFISILTRLSWTGRIVDILLRELDNRR